MYEWSYTYENLNDFLLDALSIIKTHDESFSENKYYKAFSDYKRTGSCTSFGENSHVFTGDLGSLIKNKFFLKEFKYEVIKLEVLDDEFLLTVSTHDNSVIQKIKVK